MDVLALCSRDTCGNGLQFVAALDATETCSPRLTRLLTRIAVHLGASDRLRAVERAQRLHEAEVVLHPGGRVIHASPEASARAEAARDGFARRRFAHSRRTDVDKALEVWQGLVDGRWSLVDHFDTDGKRFVLAIKNAPDVAQRVTLTPEDRWIAALAAMGHRDKEIAYILGVTMGTISAALRRVRIVLQVKTRAELAVAWRRGTEAGEA